jgi:Zn-dependent M28 family amino/carboxypeptidase
VKQLIACVLVSSVCSAGFAAGMSVKPPVFDPKRLSDEVKTLSSDEFEGRGPATPGETKTVAYVSEQMKAAGLQPGGDLQNGKRLWTQAVPLVRTQISGEPKFSLSIDGKAQDLRQSEDITVRATMDGSTSVSLANVPLVFCGYGVKAPERNWDDFKGTDLRGKIMIVLINDPIVHETAPAAYGWATVKNSGTVATFDIGRDNPAAEHTKIEAWIQRDVAVELFKRTGLDFEALKKQAQTREFKPVILNGATFAADFKVERSAIVSHNIGGRVEGSKRPDETIIYSAHWDHLGVGAPDAKGDKVYNGAVDNATGTAALIELGRAFAHGPRPERSIVLLSVTAEEKGLLGSAYYASHPLYPLAKTVANINVDSLDPDGPARNFSQSGSAQSGLLDLLIADAKAGGLEFVPDPHPESGGFFRSDHFSFAGHGVPALSFESGNDLVDGGKAAGEAKRKEYGKTRYHQPADEWQADWLFTGMTHDLPILYEVGSDLANSKQWPNWSTDSEFRAIRDATADQRK